MVRIEFRGVHRVRRRLTDGTMREHHYAWRGGPKYWSSDSGVRKGSAEYAAAFAAAAERSKTGGITVPATIDAYLDSAEYLKLADRTRADYRKWALRLAQEFRDDPVAVFEDPDSRGEVNEWRQQWRHSPKQFDYAGTVATVILNWARDNGKIQQHHCDRLKKLYAADRAEIVWTSGDIATFDRTAPERVRRILTVAVETGLRPGDLIRLTRGNIETTPNGRQVRIRTNKRGRTATIPVTAALAQVLDATPRDRTLILVSHRGQPLTEHRASEAVRQWRDEAGLSSDLRLYDARGTAATRLLRADLSLAQIATWMGWSVRFAQNIIEHYATLSPEDSDDVLVRLDRARTSKTGTKV